MKGDDYYVKKISLLYTEFKKMEGHVVQAPNSYLNTLFILNMRRSGGLAEAVPMTFKFGTTLDQIDQLRQRLLEFVKAEKREYQGNILTEIRDVVEAHSIELNVVFFYKSNWQNELLRLQRRNKFICAMMVSMQEIGIEGPRMRIPGQKEDIPFYVQYPVPHTLEQSSEVGPGPRTGSLSQETAFVPNAADCPGTRQNPSIIRPRTSISRPSRTRGESISAMSKRVDFSLGLKDVSSGDMLGDIYEDQNKPRVPDYSKIASSSLRDAENRVAREDDARDDATLGSTTSFTGAGRSRFGLHRSSTDSQTRLRSSRSAVHRNHFFGSRRGKLDHPDDVEEDLMEQGMAEIPEAGPSSGHLDPRSGIVSPQAIWLNRESDSLPNREVGKKPMRSQTEDFEMTRLGK